MANPTGSQLAYQNTGDSGPFVPAPLVLNPFDDQIADSGQGYNGYQLPASDDSTAQNYIDNGDGLELNPNYDPGDPDSPPLTPPVQVSTNTSTGTSSLWDSVVAAFEHPQLFIEAPLSILQGAASDTGGTGGGGVFAGISAAAEKVSQKYDETVKAVEIIGVVAGVAIIALIWYGFKHGDL